MRVAETASLLIIQYSQGSRASANSIPHARGRVCQPPWRMGAWPDWLQRRLFKARPCSSFGAKDPCTNAQRKRKPMLPESCGKVSVIYWPAQFLGLWGPEDQNACPPPKKSRAQLVLTTGFLSYLCFPWTLIHHCMQILRKATLIPF